MDQKIYGQNGRFVATKYILSQQNIFCPYIAFPLCFPALFVGYSFLSRHIFMTSSLILPQHNFTLSRHSYVDVAFYVATWLSFVPTKISSSSSSTFLQQSLLCCYILFFVVTEFLPVAWIFCRDKLFLYRDRVVLPCIVETELCVEEQSSGTMYMDIFIIWSYSYLLL